MTKFEEGPKIPVFMCDSDSPKDARIKRMNQNVSTLVTIADQQSAVIPLVVHTSKSGLSASGVKEHREKMLRALGISVSEGSPFAEEASFQLEENEDGYDVLTFVFMTALPPKRG